MKKLWMILSTIALAGALSAAALTASAQWFRPYPYGYRNPYQRLQQNMEHNRSSDQVYRQGNSRFWLNLDYGISQPLGSLHDYAGKTSFAGWHISLLYEITPKLAAGLGAGYYDFYQKIPRRVYQDKTTSISAVQSHTLQFIPIQPTVVYIPKGDKPGLQPYVGLGIGVADVNYAKYWGEFLDKSNKLSFSVSPMAGVRIPLGKKSPVHLSADLKYNYAPFKYNELAGVSTIELNGGVSIYLR